MWSIRDTILSAGVFALSTALSRGFNVRGVQAIVFEKPLLFGPKNVHLVRNHTLTDGGCKEDEQCERISGVARVFVYVSVFCSRS